MSDTVEQIRAKREALKQLSERSPIRRNMEFVLAAAEKKAAENESGS